MNYSKFIYILLLSALFFSCSVNKDKKYVFIGHAYQRDNQDKIDWRIEELNTYNYDAILLGGDLLVETTKKKRYVNYLDSLFDLKSNKTLWSLGNHDCRNGNFKFINELSNKPSYYSTHFNGITFYVFNSNFGSHQKAGERNCKEIEIQLNDLTNITDTIERSRYFIWMTHGACWGELDTSLYTKSNYEQSDNFYYKCNDKKSTYAKVLHPLLKQIQRKGIQVIVLSGDFGQKAKKYEWEDENGIVYLGSGISNSILDHKAALQKYKYVKDTSGEYLLEFYHDNMNTLTWEFLPMKPFN